MKCDKIKELLPLFIIEELSSSEMLAISSHLKQCESCQTDNDQLCALVDTLERSDETQLDKFEQVRLNNEILKQIVSQYQKTHVIHRPQKLLIKVAAALIIFISGFYMGDMIKSISNDLPVSQKQFTLKDIKNTNISSLSSKRFTSQGLKAIARGTKDIKIDELTKSN